MVRCFLACHVLLVSGLLTRPARGEDLIPLAGFAPTREFREQERWRRLEDGVRLYLNAPLPLAPGPRRLVLYATPNGNTIEQTLGCALAPGRDWHFDIQHVAAQIRRLREARPDPPIMLAVVQAPKLSWPAYRQQHADANERIRRLVEQVALETKTDKLVLSGHSGGGSFLFGYIDSQEKFPAAVERLLFLDANYAYSNDQRHGEKLLAWLSEAPNHRLVSIAYDDREIMLNGKRVVGPTGGTYRATQRMLERLERNLPLTTDAAGDFVRQRAAGGQLELLVHPNPDNKILHTALVGEMNGLLYGLVVGTPHEQVQSQPTAPRVYTKWIQSQPAEELPGAPTLRLPARRPGAYTGSQFAAQMESLSRAEREAAIHSELVRGNVPNFLRKLCPIRLETTDERGTAHRGTCFVLPDYLAVGADDDFLRLPMTPHTARSIANTADAHLITAQLADAIHRQADLQLEPRPLTKDRDAAATFFQHHQLVEEQRRGHALGLLVAGIKKDVVLTNRLRERSNRVAIYGWHYPDGPPIQPLYVGHVDWYVDYSHGIRVMSNRMLVDGEVRLVADVLKDRRLCGLLSGEGPIEVDYQ